MITLTLSLALLLTTATTHPMQYYVSLPEGWTAGKKWPVVMVIEGANRQFEATMQLYEQARKSMPFILVTPLVITNGGTSYRQIPTYHYSDEVWNESDRVGRCQFDQDGIVAIAADVRRLYNGEDKFFIAGWEAGAHTVWMMVLRHPEMLRGAAVSGGNFQARCMEDGRFSESPALAALPVTVFGAENSQYWNPGKPVYDQSHTAMRLAESHGYKSITETPGKGKDHGPLERETLEYFHALLAK